jgi:hypothetical protein
LLLQDAAGDDGRLTMEFDALIGRQRLQLTARGILRIDRARQRHLIGAGSESCDGSVLHAGAVGRTDQ